MAGWARDVLTGLAAILETAGVATYREDGTSYTAGETGVVFGQSVNTPDRCLTLAAYGTGGDSPREALSQVNVQVTARGGRGDYLDAVDLDQAAFDALQGLSGRWLGSVWLVQCLRRSSVPMGVDPGYRWEIASNYVLDINPPSTALRPE